VTTKAIALLTAALLLAAEPSAAAEREVISTDWSGFQKQVIARKFKGRSVLVGLSDVTEGVGVILIPVGAASIAAIGGIAGYFIGRSSNRPGPEFVITR
jgi:hypothetical protein